MNQPLRFALNRMVAPRLSLPQFIELAVALKADAIEIRNDLMGVEIEDGTPAVRVRELCAAAGHQGAVDATPCTLLMSGMPSARANPGAGAMPVIRGRGPGDVPVQRS